LLHRERKMEIVSKTLKTAASYFENFFIQEKVDNFLTYADARVKIPVFFSLIVITVLSQNFWEIIFPLFAFLFLYAVSGISPKVYLRKVYLITLFSFIVVLPHIFITSFEYVILFTLRVYLSISFLVVLSLTTPFFEILRALKFYRVPDTLILVLASTYTYAYILFKELSRMLLARESRKIPQRKYSKEWKESAKNVLGPFFVRVYEKGERVNMAMISRGFKGKFICGEMEIKKFNTYLIMVGAICVIVMWITVKLY